MAKEALAVQERVLGREHPNTLRTKGNLASSLLGQGKHPEARGYGSGSANKAHPIT